ncbi:MAG: glucosamine inositolphosphorylceramide transferase family protein [Terriglobales bacterium]
MPTEVSEHRLSRIRSRTEYWLRRLFVETTWGVGLADAPIESFLDTSSPPRLRYWRGLTRTDRFCADPFGQVTGRTLTMLCEDFGHTRAKRGVISAVVIDLQGQEPTPSQVRPVLDDGSHMSFPFLVCDGGTWYCMPETSARGCISLYKAVEFPFRWDEGQVIIQNFSGLDSAAARFKGRWWLFSTDACAPGPPNLCVWHADTLQGPWTPHARNPVKADASSCRGAGTPFIFDGALYRPSQDCSDGYGRRVNINRLVRLSGDEFAEETVATVHSPRDAGFPDGIHTLSSAGPYTLIDGRRDDLDLSKPLRRFLRHFRA